MSNSKTVEIRINTGILYTSIQYYSIIGIGIGVLGTILLNQLVSGGGISGGIIGSTLSITILSYAVLSGPIIATIIGYITKKEVEGGSRTMIVNSAVANGIGYIVFGLIVCTLLVFGLSLTFGTGGASTAPADGGGGSGVVTISNILALVGLIMIPNALVGGAVTAISAESPSPANDNILNDTSDESETQSNATKSVKVPSLGVSRRGIAMAVLLIIATSGGVIIFDVITEDQSKDQSKYQTSFSVDDSLSETGLTDTEFIGAYEVRNLNKERDFTLEYKLEHLYDDKIIATGEKEVNVRPDSSTGSIRIPRSELSDDEINAIKNSKYNLEFTIAPTSSDIL